VSAMMTKPGYDNFCSSGMILQIWEELTSIREKLTLIQEASHRRHWHLRMRWDGLEKLLKVRFFHFLV
jgi:hypothetical protein